MSSDASIGVFDSGIGGLTVLKTLAECLPHESFVYLGDTARVPYGNRTPEKIAQYAEESALFLREKKTKALVVACNTVSAACLPRLEELFPGPVFGVIESGVDAALATGLRSFLVLGTPSTVRSGAYAKVFAHKAPAVRLAQQACPLFVPLAEEGWWDHPVTQEVIRLSLASVGHEYEGIVLGCTHYPLLLPSLRKIVPDSIPLVEGSYFLAQSIRERLTQDGLASGTSKPGTLAFYATDPPSGPILKLFSSQFGGQAVHFEGALLHEIFDKRPGWP